MISKSFISSVVLHGTVLVLMMVEFSFSGFDKTPPPAAVLMVDLSQVQISDKTNLPPKEQKKKAKPQPPKPKPAPKIQPTKKTAKPVEPPKPKPAPPAKNKAVAIEPPKPSQKKNEVQKKAKKEPVEVNKKPDMKSLLASVDKVRQTVPAVQQTETAPAPKVNEGIENGTEGSLTQVLSISDRDFIANGVKKYWNVDAGSKDIDDMIVEIRISVERDGSLGTVKVLNEKSDIKFKIVSESAVRALRICDSHGDESPFRILAQKYGDRYRDWATIRMRFNPKTGSVI